MTKKSESDDPRDQTEHVRPRTGILKNPHEPHQRIQIPTCVRFVLDGGAALDAPSRRYIILGREDGDNRQQIDVDFGSVGGREGGVSRSHAIIQMTEQSIFIKDFNSRNGTFVNGYELHPMRNYDLHDGDELTLGQVKMRVVFIY